MGCGARLKDYICDHDLTQKAIAARLGLVPATLNNYLNERTNLPLDLLPKIAQELGISTDYLLGLTDDPEPPLSLTASERGLVERYRALSRDQKELLLNTAALMQKQNQR